MYKITGSLTLKHQQLDNSTADVMIARTAENCKEVKENGIIVTDEGDVVAAVFGGKFSLEKAISEKLFTVMDAWFKDDGSRVPFDGLRKRSLDGEHFVSYSIGGNRFTCSLSLIFPGRMLRCTMVLAPHKGSRKHRRYARCVSC